jgi:hypothetical protein
VSAGRSLPRTEVRSATTAVTSGLSPTHGRSAGS